MRLGEKILPLVAIGVAIKVVTATPAHAYIDPGTGAIIVQTIVGAVAAAIGFAGFYWRMAKAQVARLTGSRDVEDDGSRGA